jgi:RNA polymerase sigma factor (sigma-70 family)
VTGAAVGGATLARARSGDDEAFRELTEPHRRELQRHCYRMVGSVQDAEDLVQEALLAAWRGLEAFEGRPSVRAWLHRIATNRCLDALRARSRRPRELPAMDEPVEPTRRTEPIWLEPYPDVLLQDIRDRAQGPETRYEARESIELAFIVALQHLPPRQRAALVLRDVLGFRTAEVADMLETGEASIKGALQRARATLHTRLPAADRERAPVPNSAREHRLVGVHRRLDQRGVGRPGPDRRLVVCRRSVCRLSTSWSLRRLVRPPRGRSRCSSSAKTSRLAAVTVCRPASVMLTATALLSEGCCCRATMPARSRARTSLETWIRSSPLKSASSRCLGECPGVARAYREASTAYWAAVNPNGARA